MQCDNLQLSYDHVDHVGFWYSEMSYESIVRLVDLDE